MKRPPMLIVKAMLADASLDLDLSVERDFERIRSRFEHEGFSFLAITLPQLSDALERGLETGTFKCPTLFSRHRRLPRFMSGFFKRVFDQEGRLREDACPHSVRWIRQICRFWKKPKIGCSKARNRQAIQAFLDVEGELRQMTSQIERKDIFLDKVSGIIWAQVFPELDYLDLVCHHGPGVVADRHLANARYAIRQWYDRCEYSFPSDLHAFPNYGAAAEFSRTGEGAGSEEGPRPIRLRDELPVRVVFVPKTLTSPRVIAIEPHNVQYVQQSVKDYMYERIEEHALTKHSIRFTRQDVNQRLAYSSSIDKRLATLDLKDASDRVHLHLVQRIFKNSGLLEYLEDARSLHATLPNGKNLVLFKYASMGSALCFPVEACVFYTLIQSAMHSFDGRFPTSSSIKNYSYMIDVFGDDIIIPVNYADAVVSYLESYALKVNVSKSFKEGNFRESCGADYFKGVAVNPVYARKVPHDNLRQWQAEDVMSWTATSNLFYERGMWNTAQAVRDLLCRVVRRTIPKTRKLGSGVAFFSYLFTTDLRYDDDLQCWKQKRLHYDPLKEEDNIDGYYLACLNKWGISVSRGLPTDERRTFDHPGRHPYPPATLGGHCTCYGRRDDGNVIPRRPYSALHGLFLRNVEPNYGGNLRRVGRHSVPSLLLLYRKTEVQTSVTYELEKASCAVCTTNASYDARVGSHGSALINCLEQDMDLDHLSYLDGRTDGIDFQSSVKRGVFKSKHRWVSLAG